MRLRSIQKECTGSTSSDGINVRCANRSNEPLVPFLLNSCLLIKSAIRWRPNNTRMGSCVSKSGDMAAATSEQPIVVNQAESTKDPPQIVPRDTPVLSSAVHFVEPTKSSKKKSGLGEIGSIMATPFQEALRPESSRSQRQSKDPKVRKVEENILSVSRWY